MHRYERRVLSYEFIRAIREDVCPRGVQALLAGFAHTTHLSYLLRTRRPVTLTPLMRGRLQRLAENAGYPPDRIFLDEEARP